MKKLFIFILLFLGFLIEYIESLGGEIDQLKPGEALDFDLPEGLGEVISGKQGSEIIRPATKIRIVRGTTKSNSFIKTAYPIR